MIYILFLIPLFVPLLLFFQAGDLYILEMVINTIEKVLSLMDKIPLPIEGAGGRSAEMPQLPDLNLPAPEEDRDFPDLNLTPAEEEVVQQQKGIVENKKKELAKLIEPLIEKEVQKCRSLRQMPSSQEVVEILISRLGPRSFEKLKEGSMIFRDFNSIKRWLTRAQQNVVKPSDGQMGIRDELSSIIEEWGRGE